MRRLTAPFSVIALIAGALVASIVTAADMKSTGPEIHAKLTRYPAPVITDALPVEIKRLGQMAQNDPFDPFKVSRLP